jgi:hypothetical protein
MVRSVGERAGLEVGVSDGDSSQLHDLGVGDTPFVVTLVDRLAVAHIKAGA